MPTITLPDGQQKQFDAPKTILEIAESIGKSLAKAAVAGMVDGVPVDLSYRVEHDCKLRILTMKDPETLEILRHSTAHLLAHAVKHLFPSAQVTIGPVVEDGFYYDFAFERAFTPEDLNAIEKEMEKIAQSDFPVTRETMDRDAAIQLFTKMGELYKAGIIRDIPPNQILSLYRQGDFVDLCRGPHVPRTGLLKTHKLMKVAGAYWRGDHRNEMLQRIYGTAWTTPEQLKEYLHRLEEAKRRDHREIAKKMDLFHVQEEAPGMVFWHPHGWLLNNIIRDFLRKIQKQGGYQEVNTPLLLDVSLWQKSGHSEKYAENMFITSSENRDYAVKPMSCPCHVQIYKQGLKSYRDLPLRLAEFGHCHRNEPSGALHGIMRVRGFVQDDGHIFCTEDQIQNEASVFIDQVFLAYKKFGFDQIFVKLATRPEKRIGSDAIWDKAEHSLSAALNAKNIPFEILPGEGAFYGPKIEFHLKDCLGRVWQCGTLQTDYFMPERLGAEYVAEDNSKKIPVMLHRAIIGTLERFIGILLEQYADGLPLWLSPEQVVIASISDDQAEYAKKIAETLKKNGIRARSDLRSEKIGFKIRDLTIARIPYLLVVGRQEMELGTVSIRPLHGEQIPEATVDQFLELIRNDLNVGDFY